MDTHEFYAQERFQFQFEEMSGDLDIYQYSAYIDPIYWYQDTWGIFPKTPYADIKYVKLSFTVLKNDIEPGASRNFRLKYRTREVGVAYWDDWEYSDEFTVSVADITVSGTAGTLCDTYRDYSISIPTGYTSNWSFNNSNLVTSSTGSGATARLTGSCNGIGDGVLTYTLTKASCPTFTATRTINVNGPKASDLSFRALYTSGSPAPKSGSYYLLCPNTHYHIYLDNAASASCGVSSLTWTIPAGWTKNYQSSNMISIYTNSSPGGQVIVKGQTCCSGCGSNMSLTTGYFGTYYNCGGYYMASPNPSSDYIDIDFSPESLDLKQTTANPEILLQVYDKMGVIVLSEEVSSLPHRINTSKMKKGNYVIHLMNQNTKGEVYAPVSESIQIFVEH